ncbi:caspase family protein [Flammeovirga agarivorans]|uniref:Caspase family protein n=1 Tax=Flammeovirga agarivorans TaxID=2726742 RepID=A0A7X8SIR2_9BACT|nr:caspase family protein [Flammeovirga agarivorans]NLR90970.1 caspase family protein [Flammeovirga agarivorans]
MKKYLLTLLIACISLSIIGQEKNILVMPNVEKGASICSSFQIYDNKVAVNAIEEVYKENKYLVINSSKIIHDLSISGGCYQGNDHVRTKLLEQNELIYFTVVQVDYKNDYNGSYVEVTTDVIDAKVKKKLATIKSKSTPQFTSDKKEQIKSAFRKVIQPLMLEALRAQRSKTYIAPTSSLTLPIRTPPKKEKKEEQPKVETPVENTSPVIGATITPSDVDINIPKGGTNENAVAVIIGNKNYRNSDVPAVKYAIHDAEIMKQYLTQLYGYREGNIIYIEDATQADFNAIFGIKGNPKGKLYNYVKPEESDVFIYYSGHGAPNPESQEGYFVPVDTDPSLIQFNGYAVNTLYENLAAVPYRNLTVVIDACFSGSSDGGMLLKSISPVFIKTENKILQDENAFIFSASASEQVASWYEDKSHGLFTYFYLKGLQGAADKDQDGRVTVEEMSTYLNDNVTYMARSLNNRAQNPQINGTPSRYVK